MDYSERGTVEKALDELIENGGSIASTNMTERGTLLSDENQLTQTGETYFTGILAGILTTIRTFTDGPTDFDAEDVEEIRNIVERREIELTECLLEKGS